MVNIEEYGVTIIPLPAKAFDLALSYQISDKQVDIYIPLWSEEEGQSDLTSLLILSIHSAAPKIREESEGQTVWWEISAKEVVGSTGSCPKNIVAPVRTAFLIPLSVPE